MPNPCEAVIHIKVDQIDELRLSDYGLEEATNTRQYYIEGTQPHKYEMPFVVLRAFTPDGLERLARMLDQHAMAWRVDIEEADRHE